MYIKNLPSIFPLSLAARERKSELRAACWTVEGREVRRDVAAAAGITRRCNHEKCTARQREGPKLTDVVDLRRMRFTGSNMDPMVLTTSIARPSDLVLTPLF